MHSNVRRGDSKPHKCPPNDAARRTQAQRAHHCGDRQIGPTGVQSGTTERRRHKRQIAGGIVATTQPHGPHVGYPAETIRFYEREDLLPEPARTEGNYRDYGEAQVRRLAFIWRRRSRDMALDEIRVLLRLHDAPEDNCAEVNAALDEHIGHVPHRVAELRALKRQLKALRDCCKECRATRDCGVLNALNVQRQGRQDETPAVKHLAGIHARPRK